MLIQFMDIIFVESNKRLASQPASQPNPLYKRIDDRKPGYGRILSFSNRAFARSFYVVKT